MTNADRLVQLQMLAASIMLLYTSSKINFLGQSSETTFLAVQFLALTKWLQCPCTCRRYRALETLFGGRHFGSQIRMHFEPAPHCSSTDHRISRNHLLKRG
jgi:hypothetical protein